MRTRVWLWEGSVKKVIKHPGHYCLSLVLVRVLKSFPSNWKSLCPLALVLNERV